MITSNNLTDRDSYIDFIKGISIILVLWGHLVQYLSDGAFDFFDDTVFKSIYSNRSIGSFRL